MAKYTIPARFNFPLHHPRPRFKNYVEEVLGYVSFGIVDIGDMPVKAFNRQLETYIRSYGSNVTATQKTIANWRTEIAALFGLYIEGSTNCRPSAQCEDLAENINLPRFFKGIMASFQYPAGFMKSHEVVKAVENGVRFHPGRWLAQYFLRPGMNYITKEELCHCVMNDLRVTRDAEPMSTTVARIEDNRRSGVEYDSRGDVVRTAGDVLDYMYLAAYLDKDAEGRYFPKAGSTTALNLLKNTTNFFDPYYQGSLDTPQAKALEYDWFVYVEDQYRNFVRALDRLHEQPTPSTTNQGNQVTSASNANEVPDPDDTTEIGRTGERLAFQHEVLRVTNDGRPDLVHLIKQIPTHLAAGYDIKSIESDTEEDRFIEVKTCRTRQRVRFNNFHLTPNEWRVADSHGSKYCVYRIAIDDDGVQLFVIRDPIQKFRDRVIRLSFRYSVQFNFSDQAGSFEELLCAPTR